jgi:hypothetical protein
MPLEEAVRLEAEDKEAEKPKSEEERLQREWLKRQPIYVSVDALVRLEFPPHIVKWFAEGVPVGVQRSFFERYEKQYPIPAGEATLGAIKEVDRMLSLEVLEEVPSDSLEEVTVVSPWVVVLKSGKTRVCCDVLVNTMIASPALALPCFRDCLQYLRPDSYVAILDARDFFYAIPVATESRKYLGVRHPGDQRLLRYARLPMGLASSPFVACSFSEEVAKKLRDMGHKVLVYCDDWAVFGDTKVQCQDALNALQSMLAELQLSVPPHKLKAPSQRQTWLGIEIDTRTGHSCFRVVASRILQMEEEFAQFYQDYQGKEEFDPQRLASLIGRCGFLSQVVPDGNTHMRRLCDLMKFASVNWVTGKCFTLGEQLLFHCPVGCGEIWIGGSEI